MRIHVTWEDIRAGKAMRTSECMVALALKRELGAEYTSVGLGDVRFKLDGRYVTLRLPKNVGQKIRFWELFHFVFPITFDSRTAQFGRSEMNTYAGNRGGLRGLIPSITLPILFSTTQFFSAWDSLELVALQAQFAQ